MLANHYLRTCLRLSYSRQHVRTLYQSTTKNSASAAPLLSPMPPESPPLAQIPTRLRVIQQVKRPWSGWIPLSVTILPESKTRTFRYENSQFIPQYWGFIRWQFLHNVAGAATGVLSTQSLLYAIGLGAGSIPLAAALNWVIKDGLGQLGGVVYASFINDRFDSEPKRYRWHATVAMQCASLLEMLTPLCPGAFLLLASISNIAKNMAWLASSATRAQMHKSFMLRDNLGDITAKAGSQSTAAGLLGTGLGIFISAGITMASSHFLIQNETQTLIALFAAFVPLSTYTLYANYKSSLHVITPTLNIPRTEIIFHRVLSQIFDERLNNPKEVARAVLTPVEVAKRECFVKRYKTPFSRIVKIQSPLNEVPNSEELICAIRQENLEQNEKYYLLLSNQAVRLWFTDDATSLDIIKGFYHSCVLRFAKEKIEGEEAIAAHRWVNETFPPLIRELVARGWDVESLFLIENDRGSLRIESDYS
ncbi:uncharacterized protein VTP21DRAFT_8646 [Calcarisporiella thermophila]|uniref:uncharacterized protein n=1 Tax=Calcarisporiella thermophila TaxID=911321 RepID=UPI0037433B66